MNMTESDKERFWEKTMPERYGVTQGHVSNLKRGFFSGQKRNSHG